MSQKSVLLIFLSLLIPGLALACPGCSDVVGNAREAYVPYVVMTFVLLIYIPFCFIFRQIMKHKNLNNIPDNNADAV